MDDPRIPIPLARRAPAGAVDAYLAAGRAAYPETYDRPKTRADCAGVPRPCPFAGCRHHVYLTVTTGGGLAFSHPGREPGDLPPAESCSLDVAEARGGMHLADVGRVLGVTRERARQVEEQALVKLRRNGVGFDTR